MMNWQPGRQGTGYRKLVLAGHRLFDLVLIDYPAGTGIPPHVDPVSPGHHIRVNLALLTGGARLVADHTIWRWGERLVVFRSDRRHHVRAGNARRLVLSFGVRL